MIIADKLCVVLDIIQHGNVTWRAKHKNPPVIPIIMINGSYTYMERNVYGLDIVWMTHLNLSREQMKRDVAVMFAEIWETYVERGRHRSGIVKRLMRDFEVVEKGEGQSVEKG